MEDAVRLILATGEFLEYSFAECDFYTEGCDSAIDYTLYDGNYEEKDGGQMDYNRKKRIMSTLKMRFPTLLCLR